MTGCTPDDMIAISPGETAEGSGPKRKKVNSFKFTNQPILTKGNRRLRHGRRDT